MCVKDSTTFIWWGGGRGRGAEITKVLFPTRVWKKEEEEEEEAAIFLGFSGCFGGLSPPPPPWRPLQTIDRICGSGGWGARDKRVGKKNRKGRVKEDTMFPPPPPPLPSLLPLSARENKLEWIRIFFPMWNLFAVE